MQLESLVVGPIQASAWLVWDPETMCGVLVDPGDEPERLHRWIGERGVDVKMIIGTHGHLDHIGGAKGLLELMPGVPFALHPDDAPLLAALPQMCTQFGLPPLEPAQVGRELVDGETIKAGGLELGVHLTPGHSPGSVVLVGEGHAIVGDLVFAGSVGRTDLPGGSWEQLIESIRNHILTLDDATVLHCGHGPDTTVGAERRSNPFFRY